MNVIGKRPTMTIGMRVSLLAAAALIALGTAGCSSPSSAGHITGGIGVDEGTASPPNYLGAGTVVVRQQGTTVLTTEVARNHGFDVELPIGSYDVSARIQGFTCPEVSAHVTANASVNVRVTCGSDLPYG
jgi:hypothetical protein